VLKLADDFDVLFIAVRAQALVAFAPVSIAESVEILIGGLGEFFVG
jgi:hypothetical protein